jgi:hypothetical protein
MTTFNNNLTYYFIAIRLSLLLLVFVGTVCVMICTEKKVTCSWNFKTSMTIIPYLHEAPVTGKEVTKQLVVDGLCNVNPKFILGV